MKKEDFENEMEMLIDHQEREETDLGDKLFNFKKLVLFFIEARASFDSVEQFCSANFESSKLRGIEEVLFMVSSVAESFEDIRSVASEGVNLNDNSKRRIEEVLRSGSLEFGKSPDQASFHFSVLLEGKEALNPHDFEDFFSFSKIKINQKLGRPAPCFRDFFQTFSRVQELVKLLDQMVLEGLNPEPSLLATFSLQERATEIDSRIERALQVSNEWKAYLDALFANCDAVETFFLLMFQGKNLSSLTKQNLVHYLRLFSREMELESLDAQKEKEDFKDSKKKVEYLKALLAKNKRVIRENLLARKTKVLLSKNQLNYLRVRDSHTHQFLVHLYAERFNERLECNKILFCSEGTPWDSLKCRPCDAPLTGRLRPEEHPGPERGHLLCDQRVPAALLPDQTDDPGVPDALGPRQAVQRGLLLGPALRRPDPRELPGFLHPSELRRGKRVQGRRVRQEVLRRLQG